MIAIVHNYAFERLRFEEIAGTWGIFFISGLALFSR